MISPERYLCGYCDELKPAELFGPSKLTDDGRHPYCRPCNARLNRKRRARRSEVIDELKTGPCAVCGLALKGRPDLKRLDPSSTDRISESRLKEISGKRFATYCEGARVVCLLCWDETRSPEHAARRTVLMPFVD